MSRIIPLFSGSSGNCYYIGSGGRGILIDIGRSAKQTEQALKSYDISPESIDAVLVTHEHSDHIKGLRVFCARYKTPVFATEKTIMAMEDSGHIQGVSHRIIPASSHRIYDDFTAGDFSVKAFATSHDAAESVGYRITSPDGGIVTLATDLGVVSSEVSSHLTGSNAVIIESNHDIGMLKNGNYPYLLKRRILSDKGHLSNDSCAELLPELIKSGTTRILLAHLSEENNMPVVAFQTSAESLHKNSMKLNYDFTLDIAPVSYNGIKILF